MAIFYKHIKGTTNATSNTTGLWTWLKWSTEAAPETITIPIDAKFLPHIHINKGNTDPDNTNDAGYILTSNAQKQNIQQYVSFSQGLITPGIQIPKANSFAIYKIQSDSTRYNFLQFKYTTSSDTQTTLFSSIYNIHGKVNMDSNLTLTQGNIWVKSGYINVGTTSATASGSYIQAPYFNATSDIRAKENLRPLTTNALDIIKQVQVYTFNYKNNPKDRTIGVIAQEFLDKKLDDVSLVANERASGENGDYMSIKETKLIYLLLKGMQEQQTEIDDLKKQIKKLESK